MHVLTSICCLGFSLSPMGIFLEIFPQEVVVLKLAQWVSFGAAVTQKNE